MRDTDKLLNEINRVSSAAEKYSKEYNTSKKSITNKGTPQMVEHSIKFYKKSSQYIDKMSSTSMKLAALTSKKTIQITSDLANNTLKATRSGIEALTSELGPEFTINTKDIIQRALANSMPLLGFAISRALTPKVMREFASPAVEGAKNIAEKGKEFIKEKFSGGKEKTKESFSKLKEKTKNKYVDLKEKAANKKRDHDLMKKVEGIVPKLASGGFLRKDSLIKAHKGEIVAPVDKILDPLMKIANSIEGMIKDLKSYMKVNERTIIAISKGEQLGSQDLPSDAPKNLKSMLKKGLKKETIGKFINAVVQRSMVKTQAYVRSSLTEERKGMISSFFNAYRQATNDIEGPINERMLRATLEMKNVMVGQKNQWKLIHESMISQNKFYRYMSLALKIISTTTKKIFSLPFKFFKRKGGYASKLPHGMIASDATVSILGTTYVDSMIKYDSMIKNQATMIKLLGATKGEEAHNDIPRKMSPAQVVFKLLGGTSEFIETTLGKGLTKGVLTRFFKKEGLIDSMLRQGALTGIGSYIKAKKLSRKQEKEYVTNGPHAKQMTAIECCMEQVLILRTIRDLLAKRFGKDIKYTSRELKELEFEKIRNADPRLRARYLKEQKAREKYGVNELQQKVDEKTKTLKYKKAMDKAKAWGANTKSDRLARNKIKDLKKEERGLIVQNFELKNKQLLRIGKNWRKKIVKDKKAFGDFIWDESQYDFNRSNQGPAWSAPKIPLSRTAKILNKIRRRPYRSQALNGENVSSRLSRRSRTAKGFISISGKNKVKLKKRTGIFGQAIGNLKNRNDPVVIFNDMRKYLKKILGETKKGNKKSIWETIKGWGTKIWGGIKLFGGMMKGLLTGILSFFGGGLLKSGTMTALISGFGTALPVITTAIITGALALIAKHYFNKFTNKQFKKESDEDFSRKTILSNKKIKLSPEQQAKYSLIGKTSNARVQKYSGYSTFREMTWDHTIAAEIKDARAAEFLSHPELYEKYPKSQLDELYRKFEASSEHPELKFGGEDGGKYGHRYEKAFQKYLKKHPPISLAQKRKNQAIEIAKNAGAGPGADLGTVDKLRVQKILAVDKVKDVYANSKVKGKEILQSMADQKDYYKNQIEVMGIKVEYWWSKHKEKLIKLRDSLKEKAIEYKKVSTIWWNQQEINMKILSEQLSEQYEFFKTDMWMVKEDVRKKIKTLYDDFKKKLPGYKKIAKEFWFNQQANIEMLKDRYEFFKTDVWMVKEDVKKKIKTLYDDFKKKLPEYKKNAKKYYDNLLDKIEDIKDNITIQLAIYKIDAEVWADKAKEKYCELSKTVKEKAQEYKKHAQSMYDDRIQQLKDTLDFLELQKEIYSIKAEYYARSEGQKLKERIIKYQEGGDVKEKNNQAADSKGVVKIETSKLILATKMNASELAKTTGKALRDLTESSKKDMSTLTHNVVNQISNITNSSSSQTNVQSNNDQNTSIDPGILQLIQGVV